MVSGTKSVSGKSLASSRKKRQQNCIMNKYGLGESTNIKPDAMLMKMNNYHKYSDTKSRNSGRSGMSIGLTEKSYMYSGSAAGRMQSRQKSQMPLKG